jgi:hypothetical protein
VWGSGTGYENWALRKSIRFWCVLLCWWNSLEFSVNHNHTLWRYFLTDVKCSLVTEHDLSEEIIIIFNSIRHVCTIPKPFHLVTILHYLQQLYPVGLALHLHKIFHTIECGLCNSRLARVLDLKTSFIWMLHFFYHIICYTGASLTTFPVRHITCLNKALKPRYSSLSLSWILPVHRSELSLHSSARLWLTKPQSSLRTFCITIKTPLLLTFRNVWWQMPSILCEWKLDIAGLLKCIWRTSGIWLGVIKLSFWVTNL